MARDHSLAQAGSEEDGSAAWSNDTARQAHWENTPEQPRRELAAVTTNSNLVGTRKGEHQEKNTGGGALPRGDYMAPSNEP